MLDRLSGMLGFTMRVTERGGTPLGSLLSNKNLWSGLDCDRVDCKTCCQPGEKRENCKRRNVVYESECRRCNVPGGWKTRDKGGLEDKREVPSIYVGETCRSLHERSKEHWRDAITMKEESHMMQHQQQAHKDMKNPEFNFRVVKSFKTSLERQIGEAIRIQSRGNVLNQRGEYNRCNLTRLVLDSKWEEETWKKS